MGVRRHMNGWQVKIERKGEKIYKSFETKPEAEAFFHETMSGLIKGTYVSAREAEHTTLRELFGRYIDEYVPNLAHPDVEERRIRRIMERPIGARVVATIRGSDIAAFIRQREAEGVTGNTIRLDLAAISRLFNVARGNWGMETLRNPVEHVSRPKISPGRSRRLEPGEEERLLEAASPKLRPVIIFALETAMRRSEIAGLAWERVDLVLRTAHLPNTKNGSARTVPLTRTATETLLALGPGTVGPVFGMSVNAISMAWRRAIAASGIKDLKFHDLRHEAISRLVERTSLDMVRIQAITGHKSPSMMLRYTHLRAHDLVRELDAAEDRMRPQMAKLTRFRAG